MTATGLGTPRIADATAVRRGPDGTYDAILDPAYAIEGNTNGGLLLAILARAAMQATGTTHPHSISASFLRPAPPGPARVHVDVLRSGQTATYVRASLYRHDALAIDAGLVLGAPPDDERGAQAPFSLPPPDDCVPATTSGLQNLLERMAIRYAPGHSPTDPAAGTASDPATVRAWLRPQDDEPVDAGLALMCTDILAPAVHRLGYRGWAPTVHLTAQVHRPPAPGPLAAQSTAGDLRDGWFDQDTVVVDASGVVVARARQLARVPRGRTENPQPQALDQRWGSR